MRLTARKGNRPFGKFLQIPSLRNILGAGAESLWLDGNEDSGDFNSHCGMNLSEIIRELVGFLGDFMGLSAVGDSEHRGTSLSLIPFVHFSHKAGLLGGLLQFVSLASSSASGTK